MTDKKDGRNNPNDLDDFFMEVLERESQKSSQDGVISGPHDSATVIRPYQSSKDAAGAATIAMNPSQSLEDLMKDSAEFQSFPQESGEHGSLPQGSGTYPSQDNIPEQVRGKSDERPRKTADPTAVANQISSPVAAPIANASTKQLSPIEARITRDSAEEEAIRFVALQKENSGRATRAGRLQSVQTTSLPEATTNTTTRSIRSDEDEHTAATVMGKSVAEAAQGTNTLVKTDSESTRDISVNVLSRQMALLERDIQEEAWESMREESGEQAQQITRQQRYISVIHERIDRLESEREVVTREIEKMRIEMAGMKQDIMQMKSAYATSSAAAGAANLAVNNQHSARPTEPPTPDFSLSEIQLTREVPERVTTPLGDHSTMFCTACGGILDQIADACTKCGVSTSLSAQSGKTADPSESSNWNRALAVCGDCDRPLIAGARRCTHCGRPADQGGVVLGASESSAEAIEVGLNVSPGSERECPSCDRPIHGSMSKCTACGFPLDDLSKVKLCPACQCLTPSGLPMCSKCGSRLP
jgi:hypothetical protein